jgi:L-alanine-DL-glutamate epimerase-like enolase superfamily enzyme
VRLETDDGCVGWGEACSGSDATSVEAAIRAMAPFVIGSDPWNREAVQDELYLHGLWQFRAGTANFAWAGIDMALADLAARSAGVPLYKLFGGLRRKYVSYFFYLARAAGDELARQCAAGLAAGFDTFYLKVGIDPAEDLAMVAAVRVALGAGPRLRLDANGSWSSPEALRLLDAMSEHAIDFIEQPVRHDPIVHLAELRSRVRVAVCANEGLWRRRMPMLGSSPARRTCTASAHTGSGRSARSIGSRTSRTSRACRFASTRTASSDSPPSRATTSCSRCRTSSRATSRRPT